ncbi:hypothetical protein GCK72_017797 [Caenorhabditis remanei]|uniref:7TM GPCR serpentine receptor class x (Srx) domain-containing protein n=1 Tax=Caenorhabditis remanei TaxID=31234 RepID=A0A6A5G969_CAERE|nr:hypothetical protein GCK72_017797 [Caenorhabditis remanei]KAF1751243.1 hypothetical protein GCK72_017797 [Caenorhabditis remanei]
MNEIFRLASATIMTLVSSIGIVVNTYVLYALVKKEGLLSIFYKLCISKTICNLITCAAFLMWSACTFLNFYYLPYWGNIFWGQIAGWGAYITEGCGYIYSIEIVSWLPENSECAIRHADQIFYFILLVAIVSNSSNLATFVKLMKVSVTQDCLHMIDMLACQVIYKFNDALWFQFICMSVVWLTIHVFDGFVMMIYNRDIHPSFLKRKRKTVQTMFASSTRIA